VQKKIFKHGGSYAVDLPISFVRELQSTTVMVDRENEKLVIAAKRELDTIEHEPEFKAFVSALLHDTLRRPSRLRDVKEVWDKEWDALLKDVSRGKA
jgi:antitoxin component of MazEF toxin-antitoxin module